MNPTSSLFLFLLLVKRRTCLCTSLLVPSFFAVSKTPSSPPAVPPRFSIPSLEFSAYTYIHVCWPPPCLQPPRRPQGHQQSLFVPQSPPWSLVHILTYTSVGPLLVCSLQDALKATSSPSSFPNPLPGVQCICLRTHLLAPSFFAASKTPSSPSAVPLCSSTFSLETVPPQQPTLHHSSFVDQTHRLGRAAVPMAIVPTEEKKPRSIQPRCVRCSCCACVWHATDATRQV